MKYFVFLCALVLSGCAHTQHAQQFPEVPETLLAKCPELEKLKADSKLSDVSHVINKNYSAYHECANVHDAFIEWYHIQKKIFEGLK